jgi:tetraacyldisaccharide-1-P 4'-kinase
MQRVERESMGNPGRWLPHGMLRERLQNLRWETCSAVGREATKRMQLMTTESMRCKRAVGHDCTQTSNKKDRKAQKRPARRIPKRACSRIHQDKQHPSSQR